ncbi:MAG TPA: hypothetical protein VHW45_02790 [Candidatus Sulfotelmatobacter sp.]|nr:hypothetical protein [Candidatus Sulfotelmatobacter sp.]
MDIDRCTKSLLLAVALLLAVIAVRPYVGPSAVHAESAAGYPVFVEPGTVYVLTNINRIMWSFRL